MAKKGRYAVGAFNALNIEFGQGILAGAEQAEAPVIIQVSGSAIQHSGLEVMAAALRALVSGSRVPVVLHLDHAKNRGLVRRAVKAGFTSVMFDGSDLPFEENVRLTKEVVTIAHDGGLSAEGEIGFVPSAKDLKGRDELEGFVTEASMARDFARETGVDALAVSVGSVHKMLEQEASLNIERLKEINGVVEVPLVLHGSSGVRDDSLREGIENGIAKVNIATALSQRFLKAVKDHLEANGGDIKGPLSAGRKAVSDLVARKIRLLGSCGKV